MYDWTKKMWYIHTVEYYSPVGKDETLPFVTMGMDLENIKPIEISQLERIKNHMISSYVG